MIVGIFHQGSGLGNQLHRYVATRVRAADLGVDWGMLYNPDGSGKVEGFKGSSFIDIPQDKIFIQTSITNTWNEKKVAENGVDIRSYDPEFNFIEDNTIIDGEFQDPRYFEHRMNEVSQWLSPNRAYGDNEDWCLIGFRGGEFSFYPDLFLTPEYWQEAIDRMLEINPKMKFEVQTDDLELAKQVFPDFKAVSNIGENWEKMRGFKYAIIANSSFYILPRLIRHHDKIAYRKDDSSRNRPPITIAPRYWGRRNTQVWSLPQNYYKSFLYL